MTPFKVGDCVAVFHSDVGLLHPRPEELYMISVVEEIIKSEIVVVKDRGRYADLDGKFREFTSEGYCPRIIRLLDDPGKIAAEAVLAERAQQEEMRREINRLVQQHREKNPQEFLEHIRAFKGTP